MAVRYTITDMQEYAAYKGGRCLSREYISWSSKLEWQCEKGHSWDMPFFKVKTGKWCSMCVKYEVRKQMLEDVKAIALARGGECLSTNYEHNRTPLDFRCAKGHLFTTTTHSVKAGRWCSYCAGVAAYTLDKFQQLAAEKGGRCLSEEYVNVYTPMQWQCAEGHVWETKATMIRQGYWCPACAGRPIRTIADMQQMAKERGGNCLSKEYVNNKTHLQWQCAKGHVWESKPNNITIGHWCPLCNGGVSRAAAMKLSAIQPLMKGEIEIIENG